MMGFMFRVRRADFLVSGFPGYDPGRKELDAEVLRRYNFGGYVAEHMEGLGV